MWAKLVASRVLTDPISTFLYDFFSDPKVNSKKEFFPYFKLVFGMAFYPENGAFLAFFTSKPDTLIAFMSQHFSTMIAADKQWFFQEFNQKLLKTMIALIIDKNVEGALKLYHGRARLSGYFPEEEVKRGALHFEDILLLQRLQLPGEGQPLKKVRLDAGAAPSGLAPSNLVSKLWECEFGLPKRTPSPFNPPELERPIWDWTG